MLPLYARARRQPGVRILDPCCGTGAYLTAVLRRIHRTLLDQAGHDTALVATEVRKAALNRVFGFEIMPAPFVIAHLQLASLLEKAGASLADDHRASVYLINSLTGRVPAQYPNTMFFKFRQEREDSEHIKNRTPCSSFSASDLQRIRRHRIVGSVSAFLVRQR